MMTLNLSRTSVTAELKALKKRVVELDAAMAKCRGDLGDLGELVAAQRGERSEVSRSLSYVRALKFERATIPDMTLHPDDDMLDPLHPSAREHYLDVGLGALDLIKGALRDKDPRTILDMPCGFGRVTRHLRSAYPDAAIYACELEERKIEFCARQFGAIPVLSKVDVDKVVFDVNFDLIWCGSLLTHLDEPRFRAMLKLIGESLAPSGLALVTLQGRFASTFNRHVASYIANDRFLSIEAQCEREGFGYADYAEGVPYGIAVSSPSFVMRCIEPDRTVTIGGFHERAWDRHQDVLVLKKEPIDEF